MAIKTSSAKAKGRALQQSMRDAILAKFEHLTSDDVRSTSMGAPGSDILLSSAAKKAFPFEVECKARKGIALIYDALAQAASQHDGETLTNIAVVKADRKRPLVVIDLEDFLKLL